MAHDLVRRGVLCAGLATLVTCAGGCASSSATSQGASEPVVTNTRSAAPEDRIASTAPSSGSPAPSAAPSAEAASATPVRAVPQIRDDDVAPVAGQAQHVAVDPRHPDPTRPDPRHGEFTLTDATAGLPPGNDLTAEIETSMGTFTCTLLPDEAPRTVANFVGLARGVRDFWDPVAGRWTRRPFYDGSVFHRVIPQFMIQGGDILRSGRGGPGYAIHDENVAHHDAAGQLCMANAGPNTGGAQFFITERPLPQLNGSYSVFGRCTPLDLVLRVARVPRTTHDQPLVPVVITHVLVRRGGGDVATARNVGP